MTPRRRVSAFIGAVVAAVCFFCAQLWFGAKLDPDDWDIPFLMIAAMLIAGLGCLLYPLYRRPLARMRSVAGHTIRLSRWSKANVALVCLMLLLVALWIEGTLLTHFLLIPVSGNRYLFIWTGRGRIEVAAAYKEPLPDYAKRTRFGTGRSRSHVSHFPLWEYEAGPGFTTLRVRAPYWLLLLVIGISPGVTLYRGYRRYGRERATRCIHCGYDLTGNVSGICPECGKPA